MNISEKITALRQALRLSQEELAVRIGVTRQTVVGWEQGATPSLFNRRRICEEFELPLNYFDDDVSSVLVPVPSVKGQVVLAESAAPAPEAETSRRPCPSGRHGARYARPRDTLGEHRPARHSGMLRLCRRDECAYRPLRRGRGGLCRIRRCRQLRRCLCRSRPVLAAAVLFYGTTFLIRLILLDRANVRGRNVRS